MAAQLMGTKLPPLRSDWSCRARATNSLPVPLSPVIKTVAAEEATRSIRCRMASAPALAPMNALEGDLFAIWPSKGYP